MTSHAGIAAFAGRASLEITSAEGALPATLAGRLPAGSSAASTSIVPCSCVVTSIDAAPTKPIVRSRASAEFGPMTRACIISCAG